MHLIIYAIDNLKFLWIVQWNKVERTVDTQELIVAGKTDLIFKRYEHYAALKLIQLNFKNGKLHLQM